MIWCNKYQQYMSCAENCAYCTIHSYPQYYSLPQQYNYKCPQCNGEYVTPVIPKETSSIMYKCPFCGRFMEGLN